MPEHYEVTEVDQLQCQQVAYCAYLPSLPIEVVRVGEKLHRDQDLVSLLNQDPTLKKYLHLSAMLKNLIGNAKAYTF